MEAELEQNTNGVFKWSHEDHGSLPATMTILCSEEGNVTPTSLVSDNLASTAEGSTSTATKPVIDSKLEMERSTMIWLR